MKRRKYFMTTWMAVMMVLTVPFSVLAADEIGEITRLRGTAHIQREAVDKPISASEGMAVHLNDEIKTAARSSLRIKLKDRSVLTLGPNGHLQLNHFEFKPDEGERSALVDMFKGKLRVFAQDLETYQKKDFKVKTPTAICGVRGTLFLVWVQSDEVTKVYCFKNEIEVANVFSPEEVVVLMPSYSSDIVLKNSPSQPALVTPQEMQDALKEAGQGQDTDQPVGSEVQGTPEVPATGSGYGSGGLPDPGGDMGGGGSLITPDQQGTQGIPPPAGLPSPPPPPQ